VKAPPLFLYKGGDDDMVRKLLEVDYDHPHTGNECICGNFNYYEVKSKSFLSPDVTQEEVKFYRCTKCGMKKFTPFERR